MAVDMPLLWTFSGSCWSHELFDVSLRFSQENKSVIMECKIKSQSHSSLEYKHFSCSEYVCDIQQDKISNSCNEISRIVTHRCTYLQQMN